MKMKIVYFTEMPGHQAPLPVDTTLFTLTIGLSDVQYLTRAPIFQSTSPTSHNEATKETKSPIFHYDHTLMKTMKLICNYNRY